MLRWVYDLTMASKDVSELSAGDQVSMPSSVSPERGLFTLVQTDVYGFTRAVSQSEEGAALRVAADLNEFSRLCTVHGGKVVVHRGDGLKLAFPSPVEGMRAAIEMQSYSLAMNASVGTDDLRIRHRIGVHMGDVIVVGQQLLGKVPAITMRLEEICPPGKVCYSDDVHRAVEQVVKFPRYFAGFQEVKNVSSTVKAWIGSSPDDFSEEVAVLSKPSEYTVQTELRAISEYKRGWIRGAITGALAAIVVGLVCWAVYSIANPPKPDRGDLRFEGTDGAGNR